MELSVISLSYFLGSFFVILVMVIWLLLLTASLRKYQRQHRKVAEVVDKKDLASAIINSLQELDSLKKELKELAKDQDQLRELFKQAIQRVGLVRFDAFNDLGGELSFAATFLNELGDGVVISSIFGRGESHSYAKPIKGKASDYNLSNEEQQAIAKAFK